MTKKHFLKALRRLLEEEKLSAFPGHLDAQAWDPKIHEALRSGLTPLRFLQENRVWFTTSKSANGTGTTAIRPQD